MRLDPLITTDSAERPGMCFGTPALGLTDELRQALLDHAQTTAPQECCGLVFRVHGESGLRYAPARNLSPEGGDRFTLDPQTWAECEDAGEIVAIVHSHPNASANPSDADGVGCEAWGLPWLIVGWPSCAIVQLDPSGWRAPLQGRGFTHGVLDCFQLVRDFFARELSIDLPNFEREADFWVASEARPARDLVHEHLAEAGFDLVTDGSGPRRGDVLLMRIQSPDIDNHLAVFLGDSRFLHTQPGRLSKVDIWGDAWQRRTMGIARHRSLA